ncbi:hypothetical protein Taro_021458 [Colocasia esculenta]|uniref:Abscisic acid receptor PYR1 n=1 Tax=Colocasia esculenta TaxID=4460 RepID=A0A843UYW9_COLES|nr:hypothetical protein [Colocasia esculenta]
METGGGGAEEGEGASRAKAAEGSLEEVPPVGLTLEEHEELRGTIDRHHTYQVAEGQCSSLLSQRVRAPASAVWSVVRRFDRPQVYKHFIRSCALKDDGSGGGGVRVGCLREVCVISGLPASTSTERLDLLDEENHVAGFSIIGGEHRLRNYRSVTTVNEFRRPDNEGDGEGGGGGGGAEIWSVVLESYVVDVPKGNTEEDTRLFADTFVRLNLQKLASVSEAIASGRTNPFDEDDEEQLYRRSTKKKRSAGGNGTMAATKPHPKTEAEKER